MNRSRSISKKRIYRAVALSLSCFILAVALTSRIPTSKCHCNDPGNTKKEFCPFGALRSFAPLQSIWKPQLNSSLLLVAAIEGASILKRFESRPLTRPNNRGPPFSSSML